MLTNPVRRAPWQGTVAALTLTGILTASAGAQQRDSLQQALALPGLPTRQEPPPPAPAPVRSILILPGLTVSSPSALGADHGTVYLGIGFQARTRFLRNREDGAVVGGVGIGDARRYGGLELSVTSYSTVRSGLFERAGFSAQVHRFLSERMAVGAGVENLVMLNGDESDAGRSVYGVVTRLFPLRPDPTEPFSMITATLGIGDGRFRLEDDVFADRSTVGVFGAVSVNVLRPLSVIADWTGQDLALGASIAPFEDFPLVITPAVVDVTGTAGDGARFVLAVGIGHRLTRGSIQF